MSVSSDRRLGAAQRELLVAPVPLSPVDAAAVVTMGTLMALPHAAGGVPRATGPVCGDAPGVPRGVDLHQPLPRETPAPAEQGERPLLAPAAVPPVPVGAGRALVAPRQPGPSEQLGGWA